jgi:hypothetical protein
MPNGVVWSFLLEERSGEMKRAFMVFFTVLLFSATGVYAELHDRGGGLIYDDVLGITWLQDANYAHTSGYHYSGRIPWSDAKEWAANLEYYDSIRDVIWTDWRLPHTNGDIGEQHGYNARGSEMGHLYYTELITSNGPFINLERYYYWYADDYSPPPQIAWTFRFSDGHQGAYDKRDLNYAWAVRNGDVAPSIFVSPSIHGFGSVRIGDSFDITINVSNEGPTLLEVKGMDLTDITNYSLNGNTSVNIAPYDSHTVKAVFSPKSEGIKNATLTIQSNDPDNPNVEVQLTGVGIIDEDADGVPDEEDNCPSVPNPDQEDSDGDYVGNACDSCPDDPNKTEPGICGCGISDTDLDGDGILDCNDNCPDDPNKSEPGICGCGAADTDSDGDGIANCIDNCPEDPENDVDNDGVCGAEDNCPYIANQNQLDSDGDGNGNACDVCPSDPDNDADGDGICGDVDNCPDNPNPNQTDFDQDGAGDLCDADDDNDGILDDVDNCPFAANADQADHDQDGAGDVCDTDDDNDGVLDAYDECLNTAYGEVVNNAGCSIADLCPCDNDWKNHGAYVSIVAHTCKEFIADGIITDAEKDMIVSEAAQSNCGKK